MPLEARPIVKEDAAQVLEKSKLRVEMVKVKVEPCGVGALPLPTSSSQLGPKN